MTDAAPRHSAEEAVRAAEEEARRAEEEVERTLGALREQARDAVTDTGRILRDEADARVSGVSDAAADEAERVAAAADAAAEDRSPDALSARALESVSALLEDTARGLRETDLDRVAQDLSHAARRQPVAFLAAATAIGFAATRLVRAAGPGDPQDAEAPDDDPADAAAWSGLAGPADTPASAPGAPRP